MWYSGFCSKLRAPHRGTSLGPFVGGVRCVHNCFCCRDSAVTRKYSIYFFGVIAILFAFGYFGSRGAVAGSAALFKSFPRCCLPRWISMGSRGRARRRFRWKRLVFLPCLLASGWLWRNRFTDRRQATYNHSPLRYVEPTRKVSSN
jgi:hypothetical protein